MGLVLSGCGLILAGVGGWRGYALARRAVGPFVHEGEPTRAAIEASRPIPMRPRVRAFAASVGLSVAWLAVGFYGLFLIVSAQGPQA